MHSVSYGYQGPLSDLHCAAGLADAIDADLAKLAAMGVTVVVASGDSGSGMATGCKVTDNTAVEGTVGLKAPVATKEVCCSAAAGQNWDFAKVHPGTTKCETAAPPKGPRWSAAAIAVARAKAAAAAVLPDGAALKGGCCTIYSEATRTVARNGTSAGGPLAALSG